MNKYDVFNQPYHIGGVEIKNRFAVVPMSTGALTYDEQGGFSDNFIHYYSVRQ